MDIGSRTIKAVQLKKDKTEYRLTRIGKRELGNSADKDFVQECLKDLMGELKVGGSQVAVALQRSSVTINLSDFPYEVPLQELEEYLYLEAEQLTGLKTGEFHLNYQRIHTPGFSKDILLSVIVGKKEVASLISLLQKTGLTLQIVDVDVLAWENQYFFNYPKQVEKTVVALDLGASKATLSVISAGYTIFSTAIDWGLSLIDFVSPTDKERSFKRLASLVMKKLKTYQEVIPVPSISSVILSGGAAYYQSLPFVLNKKMEIPVALSDPFRRITVKTAHPALEKPSIYTTAVGLALRSS